LKFKIVFTEAATRMLKGIRDKRIQELLLKRIHELAENPDKLGKPLLEELAVFRSIRAVGQRYRIIYAIDKEKVIVVVVGMGLRKEGSRDDIYRLLRKLIRQKII
jgi:mRNA interferase RelE/StbE